MKGISCLRHRFRRSGFDESSENLSWSTTTEDTTSLWFFNCSYTLLSFGVTDKDGIQSMFPFVFILNPLFS